MIGAAAPQKTTCPNHATDVEKEIRGFAENAGDNVVVPKLGTSFCSFGEAYYLGRRDLALDMEKED